MGRFHFCAVAGPGGQAPGLLFTDNETNLQRLFQVPNAGPLVKDAFHDYVIHGRTEAVNPAASGTKAAAHYVLDVAAHDRATVELRLFAEAEAPPAPFGPAFDGVFAGRIAEADDVLCGPYPAGTPPDEDRRISRQAYAGLLWSKQFYHYVVKDWLEGDPGQPPPPAEPPARTQPRLGPPVQSRRDLHAGQVGISLVRRLGLGLSHDPDGRRSTRSSPRSS